jgi:aromatic ring-cleaving dioxygenase
MTQPSDPYHAHIYYDAETWPVARQLHQTLSDTLSSGTMSDLVLIGVEY